MNRTVASVTLFAAVAAPFGSHAHHSFAMFDNQREVPVEGIVREFQWTNPHVWIQLTVTDAAGKPQEWSIEGQSPNGLLRQGWNRRSIKAGDRAIVVIHPLKDGTHGGSLVSVKVDGKPIGNDGGGAPPAETDPAKP